MGSRIHSGPFLPIFSDTSVKQEVCVLPCENASRFEVKGDFMASLYSHERYQSRRLLKKLNRSADASSSHYNGMWFVLRVRYKQAEELLTGTL
jgi:hypothetical protein